MRTHRIPSTIAVCAAALGLLLALPSTARAAGRPGGPPREATPVTGVVNINTASSGELVLLPGIGPRKARAIVDYRSAHGLFHSLDELESVKGIGRKTLARIKSHLTLTGTTTLAKVRPAVPAGRAQDSPGNVPSP